MSPNLSLSTAISVLSLATSALVAKVSCRAASSATLSLVAKVS